MRIFACILASLITSVVHSKALPLQDGQRVWQDSDTGLIWDRCLLGQQWDGSDCAGDAKLYTWSQAKRAVAIHQLDGHQDWQLPTIIELYSIVECPQGYLPNATRVPADPFDRWVQVLDYCQDATAKLKRPLVGSAIPALWSSTVLRQEVEIEPSLFIRRLRKVVPASNPPHAWIWASSAIDSSSIYRPDEPNRSQRLIIPQSQTSLSAVRVLRRTHSYDLESFEGVINARARSIQGANKSTTVHDGAPESEPTVTVRHVTDHKTDEALMQAGVWRDPQTGLIWDRCIIGQTWVNGTCAFEPLGLNLSTAKAHARQHRVGGYSDWELPSHAQLHTLLRCTQGFEHAFKLNAEPFEGAFSAMSHCLYSTHSPLDTSIFPRSRQLRPAASGVLLLNSVYWTRTPTLDQKFVHVVDFRRGQAIEAKPDLLLFTRLVRTQYMLGRDQFERFFAQQTEQSYQVRAEAHAQAALNSSIQADYKQREQERRQKSRDDLASIQVFRASLRIGSLTDNGGEVIEINTALDMVKIRQNTCLVTPLMCNNNEVQESILWIPRQHVMPRPIDDRHNPLVDQD